MRTSDVQLYIGESRDSGFDALHRPGMTRWALPYSVSKSPACGGASGVNSQRSGLISSSGVSSRQSRPRTSTVLPSMATNLTIEVPIGLGRTGERSENVPRVDLLFFGLCSTRSRRD